jgi:hypothetical protein
MSVRIGLPCFRETSPVLPIIGRVKREATNETTPRQMLNLFAGAYQAELDEERRRRVLAPYRLDIESFRTNGLREFGEMGFSDMRSRFEQITFDCQFLVTGFDKSGAPCIFSVSGRDEFGSPSVCVNVQSIGFYAIGSGQYNAMAILYALNQNTITTLPQTIYNALAAKFMAESALGVGKQTWTVIQRFNQPNDVLSAELVEQTRDEWDTVGKPRRRESIVETIGATIAPKALPASSGG